MLTDRNEFDITDDDRNFLIDDFEPTEWFLISVRVGPRISLSEYRPASRLCPEALLYSPSARGYRNWSC